MEKLMIYSEEQYKIAYKELLELLKNIPKNDYKKIPEDIISFLEENANKNYSFDVDNDEMSDLTKAFIENFYRDYWVTEVEKEIIIKEEQEARKKLEDEKKEQYNPNNLFKDVKEEKKEVDDNKIKSEELMVEIKEENWFIKIIKRIKNIFSKD